jgi:hypothetical protein
MLPSLSNASVHRRLEQLATRRGASTPRETKKKKGNHRVGAHQPSSRLVMETKSTTTETDKDRERLLAELTPRERTLVESVMADIPASPRPKRSSI